jgi:drug/metabolite transporter (DMT)-like permease
VAFAQFAVCGLLGSLLAALGEVVTVSGLTQGLPSILYAGLLSVGVAFTLQVIAQRYTRAADAAILLSSEILFAAIAAALVLGERLSGMQMLGGALIFACIVAVQLVPLMTSSSPVAAPGHG